MVVLRCCEDYEDDEDTCVVWETQGLERVLDGCADVFEADTDKFGRTTFRLPPIGDGLEIEIEPARVFQPGDSRKVSWNPIGVVAAPDPQRLATLQALAEKEQEHQVQLEAVERTLEQSCLLEAPAPNPRYTKKALDLPSGEYLCRRYAPTTFRGAPRTLLFLVPADEDGQPATDVETPTYGLFLERGGCGNWRYGGAAKGTRPPALLPGRGEDDTAEKEGPFGHPCDSSQSRLDNHSAVVEAKQHSPAIPHGIEFPVFPPQQFFGRFCADMAEYGRTGLSSCRAL